MSSPLVPEHDPSLDQVDPVIDLASQETAGWVLGCREGEIAAEAVTAALTSRRHIAGGGFVGIPLSSRDAKHASRRLDGTGRLDGLALLLRGPIDRDGLSVVERARERGALLGCDTTAALTHFAALSPDLLSLSASELGAVRGDATAAAIVRVLVAMADTIGGRVLAHDVTTIRQSEALHDLGVALAQGEAFGLPSLRLAATPANVSVASFRRVKRSWTATLEKRRPSLPATSSVTALVDLCLEDADHDWIVLVDERLHPVRLIERAALLCGEPFEHQAVRVHPGVPVREVAQAALDRPERDRSRPLAVCDSAGRYRGLLMIDRAPNARPRQHEA
jgi:EAL domain